MLKGKVAVITGAAGGIGAATALAIARQGAKAIVIGDMDIDKATETASNIKEETGCNCIAVKLNVELSKDIESMFKVAVEQFNRVDILVNCAGVCNTNTIEEIDEHKWDKVMAINLRGTYLCCREAIKYMKENKFGKIVNVASMAGRVGGVVTGINYATSKGGMITMTMSLAKYAGPFGINVNAVAPGVIDTQMTKEFTYLDTETLPLRRKGEPEDVADVIVFLTSNMSRYITGCTIDVNGGLYMT